VTRALGWLGRHGTRAIAVLVFVGMAIPPLGSLLRPFVTEAVFVLLAIAFLRVDLGALAGHFNKPGLVLGATAWTSIAIPLLVGGLGHAAGYDRTAPDLYLALLLQGVASPMMATPAMAALLGLDATLVLATLLTSSVLVPLTAPFFVALFAGPALGLSAGALAAKLIAVLAGAAVVGVSAGRLLGRERIERNRDVLDGLNVLVLFVFLSAVMGGVVARFAADPFGTLNAAWIAIVVFVALFAVTLFVFLRAGRERAFAIGLMTSQRNMGLMLAGTGGALSELVWLYFAVAQLPIYLAPETFKRLAARFLSGPPHFDRALAERLVGKRLLIGLTYLEHDGTVIEQKQIHGRVIEASERRGVVIQLPDLTSFRLPPDLRAIQPARRGIYQLRATGEQVVDPDYVSTWTLTREAPEAES
jgi:BASS family bile acid:Na+ symporter